MDTNTTRRALFKLAAGLGLTGIVPTSAERIAAAEILDTRISDSPVLDPGRFTAEVHSRLAGAFDEEWGSSICPTEAAETRQALEAFERDYPAIANGGINSFWTYQESVFAYAMALYSAGLRHGAAFEHARRSVVGEIKMCHTCWGAGVNKQGETCERCGGTGTVAHKP